MGDIILSNGSTITAEELASIAAEVKKLIAKEAKDPSQYEEVGSLANLTTLPAILQNGSAYKLVRVAVELLRGVDGKEVSLRKTDTALQWQLGDGEWQDLLLLADIKGDKGDPFAYDNFTDEQIADLKRPATEAADVANQAAEATNQSKEAADQAEALRAAAEVAREQAESSRQSAETARDQAESDRGEAEDLRQTNEDARTAAETARKTAEDNRATAESTREENETERQNRETTRYANESARQLAEEARSVSEEERKANEEARQSQESDRQTNTNVAIANAEKATSDANTAAQNAIKAKEDTEAATELANKLNDHPWIIQQGVWHKWNTNTDQYESTGLQAKGDTGSSFNIVGIYLTIDDLKAAVPDGTDVDGVYAVGTGDPYDYYAWVFYNDAWQWVNQGQLRGPEGKSAYEVWLQQGNAGKTEADYVAYIMQPAMNAAVVANQAAEAANQAKVAADQAEALRAESEVARKQAEYSRQAAEDARDQAESDRGEAEDLRQTNEDARIAAELERKANEDARQFQESQRSDAESTRQLQEVERQNNTATAIVNAETATASANTAAQNAIKAKADTEAATELANELNDHPMIIQDDVWYKWNAETDAYENTGISAKGDKGDTGTVGIMLYAEPTEDTLTYMVGEVTYNFELGMSAIYPDAESDDGYGISFFKGTTTEGKAIWGQSGDTKDVEAQIELINGSISEISATLDNIMSNYPEFVSFGIKWSLNDTVKVIEYVGRTDLVDSFKAWVDSMARPCEIKKDGTDFAYLTNTEGVASTINWTTREDGSASHYQTSDKADYLQMVELQNINIGYTKDSADNTMTVWFNLDEVCPNGFHRWFKADKKLFARYDSTFNADGSTIDACYGMSQPTGNWSIDLSHTRTKATNANLMNWTAWEIICLSWIQSAYYKSFDMQTALSGGLQSVNESTIRNYINGSTDVLTTPHGKIDSGAFRFMYMENAVWGKQWLGGLGWIGNAGTGYITYDDEKANKAATMALEDADATMGYLTNCDNTYCKNVDFFTMPIEAGGSSTTGFHDAHWSRSDSYHIFYAGGDFRLGSSCGAFARATDSKASTSLVYIRARCAMSR